MESLETGINSSEKESRELRALDRDGKEIGTVKIPEGITGDLVFEIMPNSQDNFHARDLLPYERIVKLKADWGYVDEHGKIRQLNNEEVKIGKIDEENNTVSFE
ncbi:MAG: hypothetical protein U9M90_02880 [Patescibacteria group bacterium]|nr:hypothetical protein [Patescibacteria group bacterium]